MKVKLPILATILSLSLGLSACKNGATNSRADTRTNNTTANTENTNKVDTNTGNNSNNSSYKTENFNITDADKALEQLKSGNERFVNNKSELINVTSERRDQLKDGQKPYAVVISCSDSRVTPNIVFNAGLGEIFDIRIAGNVVDDNALGSIEYGVEHLNTPLIVVMGHQSCGAVTAAYEKYTKGTAVGGNMEDLVEEIEPRINKDKTLDDAIHANVTNVANQIKQDPAVKKLIDDGKVKVVEAYYSLDGKVEFK